MFKVTVKGVERARRGLSRLAVTEAAVVKHFGPIIAGLIRARTERGFDVRDRAFRPLADGSRSTLRGAGLLHDAIRFDGTRVVSKLGAVHQLGEMRMPQRRFFGVSDKDLAELNKQTLTWLNDQARAAVRGSGLVIRGASYRGSGWVRTGSRSGV